MQATSTMRCPSFGSSPVVSVSMTISRIEPRCPYRHVSAPHLAADSTCVLRHALQLRCCAAQDEDQCGMASTKILILSASAASSRKTHNKQSGPVLLALCRLPSPPHKCPAVPAGTLSIAQIIDDGVQAPERRGFAQRRRHDKIGAPPFLRIGQLSPDDLAETASGHAGPARDPLALQPRRRRDDEHLIATP